MVDRCFDLLTKVMIEYDLIGKPALIFSVDKSGMPPDPKPVKGVFSVGDKNHLGVGSGDKTQLTVVACISASGSCIPPMIVLDRKTLPPYFVVGEVPSTSMAFHRVVRAVRWVVHQSLLEVCPLGQTFAAAS